VADYQCTAYQADTEDLREPGDYNVIRRCWGSGPTREIAYEQCRVSVKEWLSKRLEVSESSMVYSIERVRL